MDYRNDKGFTSHWLKYCNKDSIIKISDLLSCFLLFLEPFEFHKVFVISISLDASLNLYNVNKEVSDRTGNRES